MNRQLMQSPHAECSRRVARWLVPAALIALAPKCILCVIAYAGLGAALGLGAPEICGAAESSPDAWANLLAWLGAASGFGAIVLGANVRAERRMCCARSRLQ